jgi:hypothetical protein
MGWGNLPSHFSLILMPLMTLFLVGFQKLIISQKCQERLFHQGLGKSLIYWCLHFYQTTLAHPCTWFKYSAPPITPFKMWMSQYQWHLLIYSWDAPEPGEMALDFLTHLTLSGATGLSLSSNTATIAISTLEINVHLLDSLAPKCLPQYMHLMTWIQTYGNQCTVIVWFGS